MTAYKYKELLISTVILTLFLIAGLQVSTQAAVSKAEALGMLPKLTEPTPAAKQAPSSPFKIRALNINFYPKRTLTPISATRRLIKQAKLRGYNTIIFNVFSSRRSLLRMDKLGKVYLDGVSFEQMTDLISYCRSVGMRPILLYKCIGKQYPIIGKLAKKYPGLMVNGNKNISLIGYGVINSAYRFSDGRTPFEAVVKPILDKMISWYGEQKPKYLILSEDEISISGLAIVAKKSNSTVAKVLAHQLNKMTHYLLKQGITPIINGNMLLSSRLSKPGNGVKGFTYDPRFAPSYHITMQAQMSMSKEQASNIKPGDTPLTSVNYLNNKEDIIVLNWQYLPHKDGQYPEIDYFQKLGFKDVWGQTFNNIQAVREFSQYAAKRHIGGMAEATFYMSWKRLPRWRWRFVHMVNNSIMYFLNPEFQQPEITGKLYKFVPKDVLGSGSWGAAINTTAKKVTLRLNVPESMNPDSAIVWLADQNRSSVGKSSQGPFVSNKIRIEDGHIFATINLATRKPLQPSIFDLWVRFNDKNSGYIVQYEYSGAVAISDQMPPIAGNADHNVLWEADFSNISDDNNARLVVAPGQYGSLLLLRGAHNKKWDPFTNGAFKSTSQNAAYTYPSAGLWQEIKKHGMRMVLQVKPLHKTSAPWTTVMSYGNYHKGFRMVIKEDKGIQFQVGQLSGIGKDPPARIYSKEPLKIGKWIKIIATISAPDSNGRRYATLKVGDQDPVRSVLKYPLRAPKSGVKGYPLGIGVEFNRGNTKRKTRPDFPGLIRSVKILPFK